MKLNFAIGLAIAVTVAEARTNPHFSWTNSTSNTNRIFGVYNNTNASAANTTLRRIPHRPQSSASQVYVVAVSQIADGQVQAPASTAHSVTPAMSPTAVPHVAFNSSSRAPASRIFTYNNASISSSAPAPSSSGFNHNKTAPTSRVFNHNMTALLPTKSSSRAAGSRIFTYHNASIGSSSPAPSSSVSNPNKTALVLPAVSASKGRPFTQGKPASWLVNATTAGPTSIEYTSIRVSKFSTMLILTRIRPQWIYFNRDDRDLDYHDS